MNLHLRRYIALITLALLSACGHPQADVDPGLAAEIDGILAIDNHAHPVRMTASGENPDRDFDALPVDNMEPQSDPVNLRPGAPGVLEAAQAFADKPRAMRERREQYPSWVLDQMGVDVMLANRVEMGSGIQPPRFLWVPYADALMFPLDNTLLAANPDRKAFFALEDVVRARYLTALGMKTVPPSLAEYLSRVVSPTLERQRTGGAVAVKFEAAYLRSLDFDKVDRSVAEAIYARYAASKSPLPESQYKPLQDFLFRYIAAECGQLGMAVHLHTSAGAGGYFHVGGANPLLLESVLNDPDLRKTKFVMLHGGWPFTREITALLTKPNLWLDFSAQDLMLTPSTLAGTIRDWLEYVPEKVLFATDAYPYTTELGWEESGWIGAHAGRRALALALTGMLRSGEITRERASQLARMVLRDNARTLYGLTP